MEQLDHFTIPKFGGINLSDKEHSIGPEETDDLCNVWGNGTYFKKRPGFRYLAQFSTSSLYPIFDIVRASLVNSTAAQRYCYDSVHVLFSNTTPNPRYEYWRINAASKSSAGNIFAGSVGRERMNRMIPCGDRIAVTGITGGGALDSILPSSTTQDYTTSGIPYGPANASFVYGAWHKLHLWLNGMAGYQNIHNAQFSDYNLPGTWPAANVFTKNSTGATGQMSGMYSDGEYLYIGKTGEIYAVTGDTVADFRMERITNAYGFADCRSLCSVGDLVLGFNVEGGGFKYASSLTYGPEQIIPKGIISIKGFNVSDDIGRKVEALFNSYPASALYYPKAEYHKKNRYALCLLNKPTATTDGRIDSLAYDKDSGAWFKWSFVSAIQGCSSSLPSCLAFGPGPLPTDSPRMYVGTHSGALGWLDDTCPVDQFNDGSISGDNQIDAYWTSAWITRKSFENFKSTEYLFIQGLPNTAGDNPEVSLAGDYGAFSTPIQFNLSKEGTVIPLAGKAKMSKSLKIKIKFANNSYGGEVRRVVLAQKGFGMH